MSPEGLYKQQMAITGPPKVCGAQKKPRSCDGVTPKGRRRERVISSLFHTSHLPCLGCVNPKKKTDAEAI